MHKRYDVVVLVASDSDHVPLVRKLHALGCKTMLLGWDFEFTDGERAGADHQDLHRPMERGELPDGHARPGGGRPQEDDVPLYREMFVMRDSSRDYEDTEEPELVDPGPATAAVMSCTRAMASSTTRTTAQPLLPA
ncbi:MAG: NYN domain-containing protein [Flavobacteriales bacterium]